MLAAFRKPQKLENVPRIIDWCNAWGIVCYLLIILFAPTSTIADLRLNCQKIREWTDAGGVISIEPFTMPYHGAPLYNSLHDFEWQQTRIDQSNDILKQAKIILPDDPGVRTVMDSFRREWPAYRDANTPAHAFKGVTGILMITLLEQLLDDTNREH